MSAVTQLFFDIKVGSDDQGRDDDHGLQPSHFLSLYQYLSNTNVQKQRKTRCNARKRQILSFFIPLFCPPLGEGHRDSQPLPPSPSCFFLASCSSEFSKGELNNNNVKKSCNAGKRQSFSFLLFLCFVPLLVNSQPLPPPAPSLFFLASWISEFSHSPKVDKGGLLWFLFPSRLPDVIGQFTVTQELCSSSLDVYAMGDYKPYM